MGTSRQANSMTQNEPRALNMTLRKRYAALMTIQGYHNILHFMLHRRIFGNRKNKHEVTTKLSLEHGATSKNSPCRSSMMCDTPPQSHCRSTLTHERIPPKINDARHQSTHDRLIKQMSDDGARRMTESEKMDRLTPFQSHH
jgi:hypothetical protein